MLTRIRLQPQTTPVGALVSRWTAFNVVGAGGIVVQLATLALLVRAAHVPALVATAIAVEAAVLHNFAWHQRWTWKDRPASSRRDMARRLLHFHALNGAVSMAGNLVLVAGLTHAIGIDPVIASAVAIVCCALMNFSASEALVFRSAAILVAAVSLGAVSGAEGGQDPATLASWMTYTSAVDARHHASAGSGPAFLARDHQDGRAWRDAAMRGDVTTRRIDAPAPPGGRVHHWVGAVFVPGATLDGVLAKLRSGAGRESESYEEVLASKLLGQNGDRLQVFMKLTRSAIITVTYNTEHDIEYRRLGPSRATGRSVATKIAELAGAGTPKEREKAPGDDSGFLWRLNAYWRYEQVDGGVLIECESVSLSRSVPFAVRRIAGPIVDRIARESLDNTLRALRVVVSAGRS